VVAIFEGRNEKRRLVTGVFSLGAECIT